MPAATSCIMHSRLLQLSTPRASASPSAACTRMHAGSGAGTHSAGRKGP